MMMVKNLGCSGDEQNWSTVYTDKEAWRDAKQQQPDFEKI